ncbi:MAG TPA: flagellar export chaperone FliS [Thermoleophilaceae bacterium]|nr:flagellar export chaperone FliS [Thermoleophilaceae bacterium]
MNPTLAPQAYKESAILTAPPERLVVMLYDGIRRFLYQAAVAMREGNIESTNNRLQRAEAIIDELNATLDMSAGGEVASNLRSLYVFSKRHLMQARLKRSPEMIEEVSKILDTVGDAWRQIAGA